MKRLGVIVVAALAALAVWLWPTANEPSPEPVSAAPAPMATAERPPAPAAAVAGPGAILQGKVWRRGVGAVGARVQVKGHADWATTSVDGGAYRLEELPQGEAVVWATLENESSKVMGPLRLEGLNTVDLELLPSASLEGVVIDAHTRDPLAGATVTSTAGTVQTDHAGRFRFAVLPAGETWIEASADGHLKRTEWLGLPGAVPHTGLQLALLPSARLQGVVERPGGRPQAGAQVWAEAEISERAGQVCGPVTTGPDGTFALECADGPLQLVAASAAGARVEGPRIKGEPGKVRTGLRIQLGEELSVEGIVTLGSTPVAGASLLLVDARSQRPSLSGSTDAAGRFRIPGVPVGSYLVQVSHGTRRTQVGPFEQTGEGLEWQVVLPPGGLLEGRVEPPQARVRVSVRSGDWVGVPATVVTEADGTFRLDGAPTGVLVVEAEAPGAIATAMARAGEFLVLRLAPAQLTVVAVDEKNLPVTDYLLILEPLTAGSTRRIPVLSPQGRFEGLVGTGKWRVSATAAGFETSPPADVDLNGSASARLVLRAAVPLRAVVLDAASLTPVAGAEVTFRAYIPGRWYAPARSIGPFVSDGAGEVRATVPDTTAVEVRKGLRQLSAPLGRLRRDGAGRVELPLPLEAPVDPKSRKPAEVSEYEGVGMQLATDGARVFVWATFEGSPAEAAGIQQGDTLVTVDGQPARAPAEQVIPHILGPSGTAVTLTVQRGSQTLDFVVRRRAIRF